MVTGAASAQQPAVSLRHRRDVSELSTADMETLRGAYRAVEGLSDDRGYQHYAGIHGLPLPKYCKIAHGQALFLAWHRAYLYVFERSLIDREPAVTLPWWDWTATREVPDAFAQERVDGQPNPLFSVRINDLALEQGARDPDQAAQQLAREPVTARSPGDPGAPPLPDADAVAAALALGDFLDFQDALEQMHNDVHVWVGGHMSDIPFAAYDPIFWSHHAMVDRIWRLWQLNHPRIGPPDTLLNEALPPFNMTVAQTLDTTSLGYDYAVSTTSLGAAEES